MRWTWSWAAPPEPPKPCNLGFGRVRIGRGALLGRALDLVPGGAARQSWLQAQTAAAEFELVQVLLLLALSCRCMLVAESRV